MSVFLISLRVNNELTITHREGEKVTGESRVSEAGFQADLMLTPDNGEALEEVGMLRVAVTGSAPRILAEKTPQQAVTWLTDVMKKML
jgi:DNA-binding FadR family transcriptional regulator